MHSAPVYLADIDRFLQASLALDRYPETERGGIYYPSSRPIHRIGLALEPFLKLPDWVLENQLDALWLHRPWQLDLTALPNDFGVLTHHLPFDESLSIGYNRQLATQLGATSDVKPLGYKQDSAKNGNVLPQRPLGMLVDVAQREFDEWLDTIQELFGGYDRAEAGHSMATWQPMSSRVAVVGAMTNTLIREASERGAHLYVTGAYRKPGQQAVDETGIAVIAVGHRRSEEWGLQALADQLRANFPIECVIREPLPIR
ncbi:Nif3-like dinuclear metal center hexameric protein [Spirosoma aerolatum]|uniref:Nif3-like dinuclear metal center hexameric protein n=1 Tax=Spirosoma aerolatum TaxID=1211326 RepID=UPI0009AF0327|nr:Nif3-like dinuclear metal center hexameric protein [Spirosoma aerolatum]